VAAELVLRKAVEDEGLLPAGMPIAPEARAGRELPQRDLLAASLGQRHHAGALDGPPTARAPSWCRRARIPAGRSSVSGVTIRPITLFPLGISAQHVSSWAKLYPSEPGLSTTEIRLRRDIRGSVVSRKWWKLARRGSGTAWWSGSGGEVKVDG
jgi:hypothetical protein